MPASSVYTIEITKAAQDDLDELRTYQRKVLGALRSLRATPRKGHALAGRLKGVRALEFSLPGGAYRAAYVVDDERQLCLIFAVGPHENFYRLVERRYAAWRHVGGGDR